MPEVLAVRGPAPGLDWQAQAACWVASGGRGGASRRPGQARGGIAVGKEEEEEVRGRSRRRRILRARVTWPLRRGAATGGYRIRGFWTRRGALVACRCCCNVGLPGWI